MERGGEKRRKHRAKKFNGSGLLGWALIESRSARDDVMTELNNMEECVREESCQS